MSTAERLALPPAVVTIQIGAIAFVIGRNEHGLLIALPVMTSPPQFTSRTKPE